MPDHLDAMDVTALRRRRDEVRTEETTVSYQRRILQGQLDIVAAVAAPDGSDLADRLVALLVDGPTLATGTVRAVGTLPVDVEEPPALPADLAAMDRVERAALADRIATTERALSQRRRELLDELDELQDELVRRYRDGGVDARALLLDGR